MDGCGQKKPPDRVVTTGGLGKGEPSGEAEGSRVRPTLGLLGFERFAAAAGAVGVGVVDFETAAGEGVGEIDYGAADVIGAKGIDEDRDAEEFGHDIVWAIFVEDHAVLQSGAAAAFDEDAEVFTGVFLIFGPHGGDLAGGAFGQCDHRAGGVCGRRFGGVRHGFTHGEDETKEAGEVCQMLGGGVVR